MSRIASYPDAHVIFRSIMEFCFSHDTNIRIDTHSDNKIMQHHYNKCVAPSIYCALYNPS